jgi:hypothetical protein
VVTPGPGPKYAINKHVFNKILLNDRITELIDFEDTIFGKIGFWVKKFKK